MSNKQQTPDEGLLTPEELKAIEEQASSLDGIVSCMQSSLYTAAYLSAKAQLAKATPALKAEGAKEERERILRILKYLCKLPDGNYRISDRDWEALKGDT